MKRSPASKATAAHRRGLAALAQRKTLTVDDFAGLVELAREVDLFVGVAARNLNDRGVSWAELGVTLGTTRQTAHARYSRNHTETTTP